VTIGIRIGRWFLRVERSPLQARFFRGQFGGAGGRGTALHILGWAFYFGRKLLWRREEDGVEW